MSALGYANAMLVKAAIEWHDSTDVGEHARASRKLDLAIRRYRDALRALDSTEEES